MPKDNEAPADVNSERTIFEGNSDRQRVFLFDDLHRIWMPTTFP